MPRTSNPDPGHPSQGDDYDADRIDRLIRADQRRKEYAESYRKRPTVKAAYRARANRRRANNRAAIAWMIGHLMTDHDGQVPEDAPFTIAANEDPFTSDEKPWVLVFADNEDDEEDDE